MIELKSDRLVFSFPEVHPDAQLIVDVQRTLRIPDDGTDHSLPPGLGSFPMRHVDDHADRAPKAWLEHGGVMLPMYQSEAAWINFSSGSWRSGGYPFAVKIAAGKINAVTGEAWSNDLQAQPQDYLSVPAQPWLDGFCVEKGVVRQFVAMPLGAGYTAEEQITGDGVHGGLQIIVCPLKAEVYEKRESAGVIYDLCKTEAPPGAMGLAPGGRMRQEIVEDPERFQDWDTRHSSRCFVHIANSLVWRGITGANPPTTPPTAEEYTRSGLPWFEYYSDQPTLDAPEVLEKLKSVSQLGAEKGDVPLRDAASRAQGRPGP
jgi:hypothetical protein